MKNITSVADRIRLCRLALLIDENKDFSKNIGITDGSHMVKDLKQIKVSNSEGGKES